MKFLHLLAATLLAVLVPAQGNTTSGAPDGAVEATLAPSSEVITPNTVFQLKLSVKFRQAVKMPATLLGGHRLQTFLDGAEDQELVEAVDGTVAIAAGTELTRVVDIDPGKHWPDGQLADKGVLGFEWVGIAGAQATVRVVPDQTDLDVDALDLTRTKVRLVTSRGEMVVSFRPDKAPNHVRNFIKLSKEGFYNGTRFHRIIRNFMIQGGCPNTKRGVEGIPGTGSPGYTVDAEFNDIKHVRGILSMARSNDPNSAGSQFFLMHGAAPGLDGKYSAFGQVESGLDVLDAIADTRVQPAPNRELSMPAEDVWLYAAVVEPVYK